MTDQTIPVPAGSPPEDAQGKAPFANRDKFCRDCRHCIPEIVRVFFFGVPDFRDAKCDRHRDLVTGAPDRRCHAERGTSIYGDDSCGPSGKYWERA